MKWIFTPATPHERQSGSLASRSACVSRAVQCVQTRTPTPCCRAYATSCGIQLSLQPASTRMYSQPIELAKSTYRFCAARLRLLEPSDHQDHADRPGLIHDVSVTLAGLARSVTMSLSVTP